jgi:hypothetical protein
MWEKNALNFLNLQGTDIHIFKFDIYNYRKKIQIEYSGPVLDTFQMCKVLPS